VDDPAQALDNWTQFELEERLAEALVANKFSGPTEVQSRSLTFLRQQADMVIAAKTGQGKTLCFGLPILDMLVKRVQRVRSAREAEGSEPEEEAGDEAADGDQAKEEPAVFDSVRALIISPTRELAMQISDMIQAVIPIDCANQIKTCCLVGGMSIQKQRRLLSYSPAIVIATPGRLWELMDEYAEPYLRNGLPMVDVLVLDEADRMVADGNFKELKYILEHIYSKRVEFKKLALQRNKQRKAEGAAAQTTGKVGAEIVREKILKGGQDALREGLGNFRVGRNLESSDKLGSIDQSKIVDLDAEGDQEFMERLDKGDGDDLVLDLDDQTAATARANPVKNKKGMTPAERAQKEADAATFAKDYMRMGGIQHIICSATLTINNQGRITPRQQKMLKKQKRDVNDSASTLESLCSTLKFRSKHPKVIDLTETTESGSQKMPDTLEELALRCKVDEKDLYLYYYLQEKQGQSVVIFCNAITATRRLNSLLDFLKVKNFCLHSKMQQK